MSDGRSQARTWELADGPWYPMRGLLRRAWEAWGLKTDRISGPIQSAIEAGEIAIRVECEPKYELYNIIESPKAAKMLSKYGFFDRVDWHRGVLLPLPPPASGILPDGTPIEVFWPGVAALVERIKLKRTSDTRSKVVPRGRPPKYDWAEADQKIQSHLYDNGYPDPRKGEQAALERMVLGCFGINAPTESLVRARVASLIKEYRRSIGAL